MALRASDHSKLWPFTWPERKNTSSRAFIPTGYLLLRKAIEHYGKIAFVDEWTGREQDARPQQFGPPEQPKEDRQTGKAHYIGRDGTRATLDLPHATSSVCPG